MSNKRTREGSGPRISSDQSAVIGRNVRKLRRASGMSIEALGQYLGYHESEMSRKETGNRQFRRADVIALADLFGVTWDDLATECQTCKGTPYPGFQCLSCGAKGEDPR